MPHNIFKPQGAPSSTKPDTGGAVLRSVPVFGIVKDNIDPIRCGRLRVYIDDMSGQDPEDSNSWATVNYMTPFYGLTTGDAPKTGYGTYLQNPSSYGMWNSPPDIGTTVICLFINGDTNYGYWIGCVPEPEALYMVPAIGAAETVVVNAGEADSYGGATKLPVSNINTNNPEIDNSSEFFNEPKPVHSYLAGVLSQQGLIRDTIRGTIGSSAQRESPSRVGWGVNTPGRPIYEGGFTDETITDATGDATQQSGLKVVSRRVGHSIVMDDGDLIGRDQLIRLRTSLGHQILMSDDGQTLFIIHANGQSYIELGKEGTIDMYATNSVNIRTQGDLNLHADNNININAKKDLNIYGENVNIQSDKKTEVKVGTNYATQVQGEYTAKTDGKMSFKSAGDASLASSVNTYINGSKVNLNTGESSLIPQNVKPFTTVAHTDTLFDKAKGWAAAPAALLSIVSRAPAHAPWAAANQGVDVKVNNDADANFPSAPSPAIAAANTATPSTPTTPVSPSVASTVPVTNPISKALNNNATTALVGQLATTAQSIPNVAAAIQSGAGIVQQAGANVAVIGSMAQTFQQLETSGVIKAGSAALASSLVQAGKTVQQALPTTMFTGQPGATNLSTYINNPIAQVQTAVAGFQVAQTKATQAGLITGSESSGQIAGIVSSVSTAGLGATVNAVKNAAGALGGSISGGITGAAGSAVNSVLGTAQSALSSGNFAANMSSTLTGGLNSIASSLNGLAANLGRGVGGLLDSAKGIAGSAFSAITKSFPTLSVGVPQNMKKIAEEAVKNAQNSGTELAAGAAAASSALNNAGASAAALASGAASSLTNAASGGAATAVAAATGAVNSAVNNVTGSVTGAVSSVTSILPNSISSGLGNLPGAQKAVSTVVNNAVGALNSIPGTAQISGAVSQITASITSGGPLGAAATNLINQMKNPGASLQALASIGLPAGAAAALNSAIGSLSSGGAIPIKLPTVGLNTTDRAGLTAQLGSVFGSTKIPVPNFAGNPATTGETSGTKTIDRLKEIDKQINDVKKEIDDNHIATMTLLSTAKSKQATYNELKNSLPAGDPQIDAAKADFDATIAQATASMKEGDALRAKRNRLVDSLLG